MCSWPQQAQLWRASLKICFEIGSGVKVVPRILLGHARVAQLKQLPWPLPENDTMPPLDPGRGSQEDAPHEQTQLWMLGFHVNKAVAIQGK